MRRRATGLGALGCLSTVLLAGGCCTEVREMWLKESVPAMPDEGTVRSFEFTTPDCFDDQKQLVFGVLWKAGKQEAEITLNELKIAKFPAQNCDLVSQAVELIGGTIGGAIDDVVGDIGCVLHLMPGPDFELEDQVKVQELREAGYVWQLFKLSAGTVISGANTIAFTIANSSQSCSPDDREPARMAFVLMSDVDDPCDPKFRD